MAEYILLMHNDTETQIGGEQWDVYLEELNTRNLLRGGSEIGSGMCMRKLDSAPEISKHINGYVKIEAKDLAQARKLVNGNPVYEAGGTVEIRELPQSN